ncbi:ATP-dependent DNA helicase RecG [Patescibacteria group bacterium]|nr:ATP-dependent DNA helicase RecG [Patescibacteria group bacterium]
MVFKTPISKVNMIGPAYLKRLEKLEINFVKDLLYHFPFRYLDYSTISQIGKARPYEIVSLKANLVSIKNNYLSRSRTIQRATLSDKTGEIQVTWFNQPFLARQLKIGQTIGLSGKVELFRNKPSLVSPDYEILGVSLKTKRPLHTGRLVPIYHETKKLSSKWLRSRINSILENPYFKTDEFIPEQIRKEESLPDLQKALKQIHFPDNDNTLEKARYRFGFEEFYLLQLAAKIRKQLWQKAQLLVKLKPNKEKLESFEKNLPFKLTTSQKKVISEITKDMLKPKPMNRLLQGDVGSGKTVVAASAIYLCFLSKAKSILMAPTEILANQHYNTLKELFKNENLKIALLTGSKKDNLEKADLIVGTHAILFKKISFSNLGLIVIDEQHRFGVEQRERLIEREKTPHVLTMTATPIPRTIALTLYRDLSLSIIDEMPPGRQKTKTWVVPPSKKKAAHKWIKNQIIASNKKIQAFVVCPLIEESENFMMAQVSAATVEFEALKKYYQPKLKLGLIHGRLSPKEKEKILKDFKLGNTNVLVSTPIIEVGIDIPQASIILIESADRFGLAQLHQLRGRVGRAGQQAYCLLFSSSVSLKTIKRLRLLEKYDLGMKLAEMDLKLRGPGEIYGAKQHGFLSLKIARLSDIALFKAAQKAAEKTKITKDLKLKLKEYKIGIIKPN